MFTPHALLAKQIAPGSSKQFAITSIYGGCDSCNVSGNYERDAKTPTLADDDLSGTALFRLDVTPFKIMWPKTTNTDGADYWTGHTFGGGLFASVHYTFPIELGIAPTVVQWLGPVYVAASYEFAFGRYYGKYADNGINFDDTRHLITGAFNVGGGSMLFMNHHGYGFGMHGGMRQFHLVSAGCTTKKDDDDTHTVGSPQCPVEDKQYHLQDWMFYYGIDFIGYTSLPLLIESGSRNHGGYTISIESGIRTDDQRLMYWAIQWSILL
jgi:hypothetical protein